MRRHYLAAFGALAVVVMLMPSADASRHSRSEWSAPVNLGPGINTEFSEAAPAISKDGLALYFVSNRPGAPDAFGDNDLYVARRTSVHQPWDWPVNLGATINTATTDGFPALSPDGHYLFFSRTTGDIRAPADILVSYRNSVRHDVGDRGWQTPVPLGPAINTAASEAGPFYFDNKKSGLPQLFFISDRPGSALVDIYVADAFGSPAPVSELNDVGTEGRVSITADGLELFFHSTRPGSAASDVYTSTRKSVRDPWSAPTTLGTDVNSAAADLLVAVSPDGDTLYFTSAREGGFGSNDLYMTTRFRPGRR